MKTKDQVGKYLTEIKELPPESEEEARPRQVQKEHMQTPGRQVKPGVAETKNLEEPEAAPAKIEPIVETVEAEDEANSRKLPLSTKDIILGVVNLLSVILLIIILVKFPSKAKELRKLRVESIKSEANVTFEIGEIASLKEKAQKLENLFLDDTGVVGFVNEIEKIKSGGGSVTGVSFANPVALKDRTGNFGVPVVIELVGTWEQIDKDLQKIDILPYLFRPVRIQVEPAKQNEAGKEVVKEGVIVYKYGVFLYVRKLTEDR